MRAFAAAEHDAGPHNPVPLDPANTLPIWLQETIGSYVSILNDCEYSLANHSANARHLISDAARADTIEKALLAHRPQDAFVGGELALLKYAEKLTPSPAKMQESDIVPVREAGIDDARSSKLTRLSVM